jgi:hypothetical protein
VGNKLRAGLTVIDDNKSILDRLNGTIGEKVEGKLFYDWVFNHPI